VVQSSHTREDGTRALPDVILHLPEGRGLVIDSKVSLVAYEECHSRWLSLGERTTISLCSRDSSTT
jgi:DNA anti-recombination protein RmuC